MQRALYTSTLFFGTLDDFTTNVIKNCGPLTRSLSNHIQQQSQNLDQADLFGTKHRPFSTYSKFAQLAIIFTTLCAIGKKRKVPVKNLVELKTFELLATNDVTAWHKVGVLGPQQDK